MTKYIDVKEDGNLYHLAEFDTVAQMAEYCKSEDRVGGWRDDPSTKRSASDWNGNMELDEAIDNLLYGWDKGYQNIVTGMPEIGNLVKKKRVITHVAGSNPVVGRAIIGHPRAMRRVVKRETEIRVLNVVVDSTYNAGVSAERVVRRGQLITTLIDRLEKIGIRCSIWIVDGSTSDSGNEHICTACKLKNANEPLNIRRTAFSFISPAYLRRVVFRVMETSVVKSSSFYDGYGRATDASVNWYMKRTSELTDAMLIPSFSNVPVYEDTQFNDYISRVADYSHNKEIRDELLKVMEMVAEPTGTASS